MYPTFLFYVSIQGILCYVFISHLNAEIFMNGRILLIGNRESLIVALVAFLAECGFQTEVCREEKSALRFARTFQPDLVLSQMNHATLTGMELARLFKSFDSLAAIPFLLLTETQPTDEDLERADMRIPADDFIELPIDRPRFLRTIDRWLQTADRRPLSVSERMAGSLSEEEPANKRKSWRKGLIGHVTLGRLCANLVVHQGSGHLIALHDRRRLTADVRRGQLIAVEAVDGANDSLMDFLVQFKTITERERQIADYQALNSHRRPEDVLLTTNLITPEKLAAAVRQMQLHQLLRLWRPQWHGAAFEFTPRFPAVSELAAPIASLADFLKAGIFSSALSEELAAIFRRRRRLAAPLKVNDDFATIVRRYELDGKQQELALNLDGKSLDEIAAANGAEYDSYLRMAFFLATVRGAVFFPPKLVAVTAGSEQPEATPPDRSEPPEQSPEPPSPPERHSGEKGAFRTWNADEYHQEIDRAQTLCEQGNFTESRSAAEKALQLNPNSSAAMALLAWSAYSLFGRENDHVSFASKQMLKDAISLDEGNDQAMVFLAFIYRDEGKYDMSRMFLQKALENNPANGLAERELGLYAVDADDIADAKFRQ